MPRILRHGYDEPSRAEAAGGGAKIATLLATMENPPTGGFREHEAERLQE